MTKMTYGPRYKQYNFEHVFLSSCEPYSFGSSSRIARGNGKRTLWSCLLCRKILASSSMIALQHYLRTYARSLLNVYRQVRLSPITTVSALQCYCLPCLRSTFSASNSLGCMNSSAAANQGIAPPKRTLTYQHFAHWTN